MLLDHLFEHHGRVLGMSRADGHFVYERNLLPYGKAQPVGLIQHLRSLRIMRVAQKVASHLFEQAQILPMHIIAQRIAVGYPVLMAIRTHQLDVFSIDEKAFFRIETEPSESEGLRQVVDSFARLFQQALHIIHCRMIGAPQIKIPHVRAGYRYNRIAEGGDGYRGVFCCQSGGDIFPDDGLECQNLRSVAAILQVVRDGYVGAVRRYPGSGDIDSGASVVRHAEMLFARGDQMYRPVYATEESEIGGQGRHVVPMAVVGFYGDVLLSRCLKKRR